MSAAPRPASPHAVLIWLIRGTGLLLFASSLFAIIMIGIGSFLSGFRGAGIHITTFELLAISLVMALFFGILAKVGYDMFRKMNKDVVSNFAFIFAYMAAKDIYHLLPHDPSQMLSDLIGSQKSHAITDTNGDPLNAALAFISFLVLWFFFKETLLRVLELNSPAPGKNSRYPTDPAIPEFPKRSPLVEL